MKNAPTTQSKTQTNKNPAQYLHIIQRLSIKGIFESPRSPRMRGFSILPPNKNLVRYKSKNVMAKEKITPADNKFLDKFLGGVSERDFNGATTRSNRFTGEAFEVGHIEARALDFIFALEPLIGSFNEAGMKRLNPNLKSSNAIQAFDRARMLVLKFSPEAYMGILD